MDTMVGDFVGVVGRVHVFTAYCLLAVWCLVFQYESVIKVRFVDNTYVCGLYNDVMNYRPRLKRKVM